MGAAAERTGMYSQHPEELIVRCQHPVPYFSLAVSHFTFDFFSG
jgi:hypothetical protein